ncbi:MAG: ATP-dependent RecD-like DNA helicase, partial [Oscillospiraceae bacterium]|nr:ATP-dependent RecD-like DNA helicase [Oscillospiraceae bacterium]
IIKELGERSFEILENDPDKLAVINGISKKKALEICSEFKRQYAMRTIMLELESYGITPAESSSIYKYFGINAVNIIKENPYILCGTVNGFDFTRAEKLCADMKIDPPSVFRNAAGILYIITHNLYSNGHTCIPRGKIVEPSANLLGINAEETELSVQNLIFEKRLFSVEINGEDFLFLPDIYNAEREISERLLRAVRFSPSSSKKISGMIADIENEFEIEYAAKQVEAISTASEKGLLILTGGPGTGKTTTVKGIIGVLERQGIDIVLCAPTGMASKRMSEVTGKDAKTIHRLLEVEWSEDDRPVFRRNASNPLRAGAVIVDEVSMVDVELMASLLDAIPLGCRVVLVGDSDQLPSVGPGNVLGDIIASGVMPVVCLTEIFRQAQKSLIVTNAHRIIAGEPPVLDRADNDFFFMKRENQLSVSSTVTDLISRRLPDAYGFSPIDDIQILCPSKRGECGTFIINKNLQAALNPPAKNKSELRTPSGRIFREGDRVMQIKNNYDILWKKDGEEGAGIFNGDIGIIKKINYLLGVMNIDFDGRTAEYPNDNLSELDLAYAVTVHKSQGSEYPAVIIPLIDCPLPLMYRNLLYTAVTRAKKILIIVGDDERVYRMTANNKQGRRYSALGYFLRERQ